jgi:protein-S-isoprenylcysteine O-methyltransferase Ste14
MEVKMKILRACGIFISTFLIYLAFSLIGWGIENIQEFFIDPARMAYAITIAGFALLVGIQSYNSLAGIQDGKDEIGKRVRRQSFVGWLLGLVILAANLFIAYASQREMFIFPNPLFLSWMGVVFCAIGYFLIYWSGLSLGRQYSAEVTIQKDHQLITTGPYKLIRHPRYLGIFLVTIGLTLLFHVWIGFAFVVAVLGLILFRIKDEENLMHSHFGKTWEEYRRHSWRLVPYLF